MQKRKGGTHIKHSAAAALLSLLLLACLPGSAAGAAVRGTDSPAPRLLLSAAPDSPTATSGASGAAAATAAATDLLLCLESAPRRFALLLRLEAPDGWRLDVSAGEIPLASRRLSDSSLLLLLDGQTASASPVLARLTVTRPPGASGCVRVLPYPDDPSIYYWKETENMSAATSAAMPAAARLAACGFLLPEAGGSATTTPPETSAPPKPPPAGNRHPAGNHRPAGAADRGRGIHRLSGSDRGVGRPVRPVPVPRAGGRGMPAPRSGLPGTPRWERAWGGGVWRFRGCPRCAPGRAGFMRQGLAVSCWRIRIPGCPPRGSLSLPCVTAPGFCAPPCTGTERLRGIVIDGAGFLGGFPRRHRLSLPLWKTQWRLSPGGTGYPCRCGKLNGGFPPAALANPCRCGKLNGGFPPAALAIPAAVKNSMVAFPPAALAIPAAVENSMAAFPRRHWLALPRGRGPSQTPPSLATDSSISPGPPLLGCRHCT
ncbi:MAG: hypothetical protein L6V84_04755 [Oscillospiraceae bacterium]|nr:MAG: hypothetical protein L6V84_04755 [Oscillospiraceae bacterium]